MRKKGTLLQEKNFKFTLIHIPRFGNHRRQSGNLKHAEKPDIRYTPVYTCLQTFVKNILGAALGLFCGKTTIAFFFITICQTPTEVSKKIEHLILSRDHLKIPEHLLQEYVGM